MIATGVFDLETTGVDTENSRIVTAYVGLLDENGAVIRSQEWIVDEPEHYSPEAAAVHGWTQEKLAATKHARRGAGASDEVALEIAHLLWGIGEPVGVWYPIATHNGAFDFSILAAHLRRRDTAMLPFGDHGLRVLDSYVLDKHYDKWLKGTGQRKLVPTAARYGIPFTEDQAHDASFDAIAAGRICQAIIAKHAPSVPLYQLHNQQIGWRYEQQTSLQKYLRSPKGGEPDAICEPGWPVN